MPANRDRKNLSVKLSYDEGDTWPVNKSLEPSWTSGYSDLAAGPDGTVYCLYERRPRRAKAPCNLGWSWHGSTWNG